MVHSCSAFGCTNRYKKGESLQFFSFPLKNRELLKAWVLATRREKFVPTKYSKLCGEHFVASDFLDRPGSYIKKLKPNAIPSVFKGFPSHLKKKSIPRRPLKKNQTKTSFGESSSSTNDTVPQLSIDEPMDISLININQSHSAAETDISGAVICSLKSKIKTLQQKIRRRDKKINNLKEMLEDLKKNGYINDDIEDFVFGKFDGMLKELFSHQIRNACRASKGLRYSNDVKKFAMTLHYCSPKAYEYCRKIFSLPHKSTITSWTSSINADPGFINEVFEALINISVEEKDCNLVVDAMSIRSQRIWDSKSGMFLGYCDYGKYLSLNSDETLATEALVFMLVSLRGKWKWPIGYFFTNKLSAASQTALINTALSLSAELGLRVWGVTCDGSATNLSSLNILGCSLYASTLDSLKASFKHPNRNETVHAILDACHMLKLSRNALGDLKIIKSENGSIEWRFLEKLNRVQNEVGLKLGNKLSSRHIDFHKNIMKVKICAQTFSSSTADAIDFLRKIGHEDFQNSEATVEFIRAIDKLFDFLNSSYPFATDFKSPLFLNNIDGKQQAIMKIIRYLYTLKDQYDNLLVKGGRKTFIIGFAATTVSIFKIAKEMKERTTFKYILTYKFSQDHIEMLFSRIRGRFGWNNNPNILQFKTALKQILLRNEIRSSDNANVAMLNSDSVGSIFAICWPKKNKLLHDDSEITDLDCHNIELEKDDFIKENILYYISGFICYSLLKKIKCINCAIALTNTVYDKLEHNYSLDLSLLTRIKNRGGLLFSSRDIYKVIKCTEKIIKVLTDDLNMLHNFNRNNVKSLVVRHCFEQHIFNSLLCAHKVELIKLVIDLYIKIRCHAIARSKNQSVVSCRQKFNKLVLFSNQ